MPPCPPRRPWMDLSPAGRVGGEKFSPSLERPPDDVASRGAYSALTSLPRLYHSCYKVFNTGQSSTFLQQKKIFYRQAHSLSTAISRDNSHLKGKQLKGQTNLKGKQMLLRPKTVAHCAAAAALFSIGRSKNYSLRPFSSFTFFFPHHLLPFTGTLILVQDCTS